MPSPRPPFASIWVSPFRPLGALGVAYGVALMAAWVAVRAGVVDAPGASSWHAHEMLYGFAGAIVCAIVLTALPGWAGTPELRGAPLAAIVLLWIAARAGYWLRDALPAALAGALACALWVVLGLVLARQLARLAQRTWLALLVVVAGLAAGEALFFAGQAQAGERTGLHAIVLLFALAGGLFTPVFTGNHLRLAGRGAQASFLMPLELAAVASIVALAALDLAAAPPRALAAAAFAAFAVHGVRLARWRGWKALDAPLLWTMHAGYAWLVAAFLLFGLGAAGFPVAAQAWLHAFTVGALGSMMIGLLTRVALRHTGRPLAIPHDIVAAFLLVQVAALARVGGALAGANASWIVVAGLAWAAAFAIYLRRYGAVLTSPSLPRAGASPLTTDTQPPPAGPRR